jgi:hypothetical protein
MASAAVPAPSFPTTIAPHNPDMLAQAAEAKKYEQLIRASAAKFGLQVCVVCGIGSRESRWGLALKPPGPTGTGDATPRAPRPPLRTGPMPPDGQGYGRGLMQIDFDAQPFAQTRKVERRRCEHRHGLPNIEPKHSVLRASPGTKRVGLARWHCRLQSWPRLGAA